MKTFKILFLFSALLFVCASCETQTTIINNVSERDANEIVVLLASKGIRAEKKTAASEAGGGGGGAVKWNIEVPSDQITAALAILNQSGLPRVKGTTLLDLFGSSGLVPSELQDRIRYQEGLSEQLATTIRKMDGIIDANVQITFPRDDEKDQVLRASVYVKHLGILDNPNSLTITKIKRLIASAAPGLTTENVTVVTDRALYADISLDPIQNLEGDHNFVTIWGVVLATESTSAFRFIFYSFIILLFALICLVGWTGWKFWPIIRGQTGGFRSFIQPEQYRAEKKSEPEMPEGGGEE